MLLACFLLCGILPAPASAAGTSAGHIDVLFYFSEEEYLWGSASTNESISIASASEKAAADANIGFEYNGVMSKIKGLAPSQSDTWRWALHAWDASDEMWLRFNVDFSSLTVHPGDRYAWCPDDQPIPAPNPLTKYPWPMFKCSASRQSVSPSPPALFNLTYWTTGTGAQIRASPCVAMGKMFVTLAGNPERMLCLRTSDGSTVWTAELAPSGNGESSPAYYNESIIVGCGDGKVRSLDARSGRVEWTYMAGAASGLTTSPAVFRGRIVFAGADFMLHCIDENGGLIWKANLTGPVQYSSPAIWTDKVLVGTKGGVLQCFNLSDGASVWNVTLGGEIVSTPAVSSDGYAFVTSMGATSMNFYSLFIRDSVMQWNASYPSSRSSPAFAADGLYLGTGTEFIGHHPDRGTRMWGLPYANVNCAPSSARGYVYFATESTPTAVVCAKVGGAQEWSYPLDESFSSSPAVADGRLFACSAKGTILCLGREPKANVTATVLPMNGTTYKARNASVHIVLNNTGERSMVLSLYLTENGVQTGSSVGPIEVMAQESRQVNITWKPQKTGYRNVSLEVVTGEATVAPATVRVIQYVGGGDCVIVAPIISLAVLGIVVPMLVRWNLGGKVR
jgi:outer membrane protein assembly factor BamB